MNKFYLYKFEDFNGEILFVGITNNLKKSINYSTLPAEIKNNLEKKHIQNKCKIYFHLCENKSDMKIKGMYLIAKLNPLYNKNLYLEDAISFEIPIKWKKCLFSDFQIKKESKKEIKVFILNLENSSYERLINIYMEYNLQKNFSQIKLTEFIEIGVLFYANFLKKNGDYFKVTDSFKQLLLRPGRRPFREFISKNKISSCINLDVNIYNTFLDVTYSHVIKYDISHSENYSLSYMTIKLMDFLEVNKKHFYKFK
jgi:hypothetical protein